MKPNKFEALLCDRPPRSGGGVSSVLSSAVGPLSLSLLTTATLLENIQKIQKYKKYKKLKKYKTVGVV